MPKTGIKETNNIIRAIQQKYSYDFNLYELSAFRLALDRPVLLHHLKYPELLISRIVEDNAFFDEFLFEITDTSVEFFRDPDTWKLLKSDIFPKLYDAFNNPKIWLPAAYNGQDLYSLLILLKTGFPGKSFSIEISSISEKILQKISRGEILSKQLESGIDNFEKVFPYANISSFLKPGGKNLFIDLSPFQNISYRKQNLTLEPGPESAALIFFRNILLKYSLENKFKILDRLTSVLEPGGYLIIGIKENIDDYILQRQNLLQISKSEKVYIKIK